MWSLGVFFVVNPNDMLNKQLCGQWNETPLRRHDTVRISKSIDQCNGMIPNRTKAMATQFTDAYLSLDSDKWNDKER